MNRRMVLVVDEDEATIDLVEDTLKTSYRILRVPEGKRAIELAQKGGIELAIVSRCLPDIDGLEVLKTLTDKLPSIPVMFVAAAPTKDLIISAFRSGARDFIEKPIDTDTLLESINRVTGLNGKSHNIASFEATPAVPRDQKFFSFTLPNRIFASTCFRQLGTLASHFFGDSRGNGSKGEAWSHEANSFTITTSKDEILTQEQEEQEDVVKLE